MTLRPAIERAMLRSALAQHWDGQSAWQRRAGPGRSGTPRLARARLGPASPLGCDRLPQPMSDPSPSHSRRTRWRRRSRRAPAPWSRTARSPGRSGATGAGTRSCACAARTRVTPGPTPPTRRRRAGGPVAHAAGRRGPRGQVPLGLVQRERPAKAHADGGGARQRARGAPPPP